MDQTLEVADSDFDDLTLYRPSRVRACVRVRVCVLVLHKIVKIKNILENAYRTRI
jgi:hypothetical protein